MNGNVEADELHIIKLHDQRRQIGEQPGPGLRLRQALTLPIYAAALLLVLLLPLGVLFWPTLSERSRRRRLAILAALTGDAGFASNARRNIAQDQSGPATGR